MLSIKDSFEAQGRRQILIKSLREKGITDENVLAAINRVPRHLFVDNIFLTHAYSDKAFPINNYQTISQPYTVAIQSSLLNIKPYDKILEIGTGSGYQAAILAELGAKVYSIERIKNLHLKAKKLLLELGYNIQLFYGDGYAGKSQYGPFDGIIITAAIKEVPQSLLNQLKIGGKLIAPIGESNGQIMTVIKRISENSFSSSTHGNFTFVPMLRGTL